VCGGVCLGPVGRKLQFAGELIPTSYYGDLGHHIEVMGSHSKEIKEPPL
jgi:hypothetical protein